LDNNIARLAEDHENAALLLDGLKQIDGIRVEEREMATNMVYFSVEGIAPELFMQKCLERGVRFSLINKNRIRAVTHLDVGRKDIEQALNIIRTVFLEK